MRSKVKGKIYPSRDRGFQRGSRGTHLVSL